MQAQSLCMQGNTREVLFLRVMSFGNQDLSLRLKPNEQR